MVITVQDVGVILNFDFTLFDPLSAMRLVVKVLLSLYAGKFLRLMRLSALYLKVPSESDL